MSTRTLALLVLALAAAAAILNTTTTAGMPVDPPADCPTVREHNQKAKRVFAVRVGGYGGDYHGHKPKQKQLADLAAMRVCMKQTDPPNYRLMRGAYEHRSALNRFYRDVDEATPFGEWSIPAYIVYCESKYSYTVLNGQGSDASGAYQFLGSTWRANGGGVYASEARYAPPYAQHLIAARLYRSAGSGPWSCA